MALNLDFTGFRLISFSASFCDLCVLYSWNLVKFVRRRLF